MKLKGSDIRRMNAAEGEYGRELMREKVKSRRVNAGMNVRESEVEKGECRRE